MVEEMFTGTDHVSVPNDNGEKVKLTFFKQISTGRKNYNKMVLRQEQQPRGAQDSESEESDLEVSDEENEDEDFSLTGEDVKTSEPKSGKKSYERMASEAQQKEDAEFLQYRQKKLAQLDKKGRHLLMYSNVNQLNFVDINQLQEAKAWTILFHFRNKSTKSMLFEEFNSVSQRNAISKTKGHQLFSQFYVKVMEATYEKNVHIQLATGCDQTGWPVDILLRSKTDRLQQPQALYFLLTEELCYNALTMKQEPLGLQKLMVRHLEQISDYKVYFVSETDVINNLDETV